MTVTANRIVAYYGPATNSISGLRSQVSMVEAEVVSEGEIITVKDRGVYPFLIAPEDFESFAQGLHPQQLISLKNNIALLPGQYIGADVEGRAMVLKRDGTEVYHVAKDGTFTIRTLKMPDIEETEAGIGDPMPMTDRGLFEQLIRAIQQLRDHNYTVLADDLEELRKRLTASGFGD